MKIDHKFVKQFNKIASKLNLQYKNIEIYQIAFTHKTYGNEHNCEYNERLEFLGDAILDFVVGEYLFKEHREMLEGDLTKTRAKYVLEEANAEYSRLLNLGDCILLGKGEEAQGGRTKNSILGDLFEAFLGAVYLDLGLDSVKMIMNEVLFSRMDTEEKGYFEDYKSKLQEYIQAESREGLVYTSKEIGPSHDRTFIVEVSHEGVILGEGSGKSKNKAEQAAAKAAIDKMVR